VTLELTRVVEVFAESGEGDQTPVLGSGYIINERLTITAAHVVRRSDGTWTGNKCRVRQLGVSTWTPARPVWASEDSDIALLELDVPAPVTGAITRFARVAGADPVPCTAVGFPAFKKRRDQSRDSEQMLGNILPLSQSASGRLDIDLTTSVPTPLASSSSPWAGMAGAALFADDYLVGVITEAPEWGGQAPDCRCDFLRRRGPRVR
jgi:hypothetical protein